MGVFPEKAIFWNGSTVSFIDQTALPVKLEYIETEDYRVVIKAIKSLQIRGAPLIGIAAAYGAVLGAQEGAKLPAEAFAPWITTVLDEIEAARPTAKNLFFAIEKMRKLFENNNSDNGDLIRDKFLECAEELRHEDEIMCEKIGEYGAELINDGDGIITHCNTGMLVTAGIGTALGVVFTAAAQGKKVHVFADETRPLLQGARLTTWECKNNDIPVTLLCDGAAASVIRKNMVQCAIVGADRIAANGDTANKIGTYSLAVQCKEHGIPFYVAAPYSTFDFSIQSGDDIPIEERNAGEITHPNNVQIAPDGISVYNPAFDVTPASFISAIITDAGVFRYPYGKWGKLKNSL